MPLVAHRNLYCEISGGSFLMSIGVTQAQQIKRQKLDILICPAAVDQGKIQCKLKQMEFAGSNRMPNQLNAIWKHSNCSFFQ